MSDDAVILFIPLPPWRDGGTIWFRCFRRSDGWWWHGVRAEWRPHGRRYHLYCSTDWWYFEGDIETDSYTIEGTTADGAAASDAQTCQMVNTLSATTSDG